MNIEQLLEEADKLAVSLVQHEVDINELKKLHSYLNTYPDVHKLIRLLDARWKEVENYEHQARTGKRWRAFGLFVRSQTTCRHLKTLRELLPPVIERLPSQEAGILLGWTARLATAYREQPQLMND